MVRASRARSATPKQEVAAEKTSERTSADSTVKPPAEDPRTAIRLASTLPERARWSAPLITSSAS